jgi:hypothetical protein
MTSSSEGMMMVPTREDDDVELYITLSLKVTIMSRNNVPVHPVPPFQVLPDFHHGVFTI